MSRETTGSPIQAVTRSILALAVAACGPPADDLGSGPELSRFESNVLVSGRVLENVTACEVDADCYLRVEFADTSVVALYGAGERPAPQCEIPRGVSDAAFRAERGEILRLVVAPCDVDGLYIRDITRDVEAEGG